MGAAHDAADDEDTRVGGRGLIEGLHLIRSLIEGLHLIRSLIEGLHLIRSLIEGLRLIRSLIGGPIQGLLIMRCW